jgi:malonyl-CoA/methylmalonyl-CoA synthetase
MTARFINLLRTSFANHATRTAIFYGRAYSYREIDARAQSCAGWLQGLGVNKGDRVALYTEEKLPFLLAHLGALYAGAVSVPLNPRFTKAEMRYFLADSEARLVVVGTAGAAVVESLRQELPGLQTVVADSAFLSPPPEAHRERELGINDPCLMIYSSGTTGWPKGVVHTQGNVASSLFALQACWRLTAEDQVLNVLPLFHIHGLSFATWLALIAGACVRIEDGFHPLRTLAALRDATVFMAVPTIYYRWLEAPEFVKEAEALAHVRLFTCGSAPIRPEVLPRLESVTKRPIINRYGMSEAHVITSLPLDGPWPAGSVGLPLNGIEVRVLGKDGQPAAANEVGSVMIRGPNLFREYWRNPEATRVAFASGWFDTGDLGSLDPLNFLTLVGRKNDLIITNGYNVYAQVVERVLNACPGVAEAVVLGVPDARRGERVSAVLVRSDPALDEERVRDHCALQLVDYQRPLDILFVDALPRNPLGKVLRRELQANILHKMGLPPTPPC